MTRGAEGRWRRHAAWERAGADAARHVLPCTPDVQNGHVRGDSAVTAGRRASAEGARGKEGRWAWGTFWGDENVLKPDRGVAV